MVKKYQKQFTQFLSEVKSLKDAEKAQYEISDEAANIILLSGEVLGQDTNEKIVEIGRQHGFHVITAGLSVMYRTPGPTFTVE